jgi:two-component system KDP operon response regulator KdpE
VALRHVSLQQTGGEEPVFILANLQVDFSKRQVCINGKEVHVTPIEYKLLSTLIRYAGKVITHGQLMKEVWGPGYADQTHYLRIYMAQLRHKLEDDPARPRFFINEPGIGYRLRIDHE